MAWNTTALSNRLGIKYPLIQAPTSGGFTSPGWSRRSPTPGGWARSRRARNWFAEPAVETGAGPWTVQ